MSSSNGDRTALRESKHFPRRALLLYSLTIVAPTLLLLWLALESVHRQREALAGLAASNLRLTAARVAEELEHRAGRAAQACLRDAEMARLRLAGAEVCSPGRGGRVRARLEELRRRHPIALHPFILEGAVMRFPLLQAPPPRPFEADLAAEDAERRERLAELVSRAESLELVQGRPELALLAYREGHAFARVGVVKALTLGRVARCLRKLNRPNAAEQAYRTLSERYGDLCDAFHRPYALVAALERDALAMDHGASAMPVLFEARSELARRRFEVSGDQLGYFASQIEARLGATVADGLEHVRVAATVQRRLGDRGRLRPDTAYADSFTEGGRSYQIHYALLPVGRREVVGGFAADLDWIETRLLPECARELGIASPFAVRLTAPGLAQGNETRAGFRSLFPFWHLSVSAGEGGRETPGRRALLLFGGSTALILAVLGLGVFLLVRDASRERQVARLRADFVSGVSHELKTPLTLIRLYGETLLLGEGSAEEERREYCRIIVRESERLGQLIDNVLDFSRIDRGEKGYRLQEGDLIPVIRRTVDAYGEYLRRRGFHLETDLQGPLPPVRFDVDAVAQALVNLLDNAIKYSGESRLLAVRLRASEDRVVLEVEDHGMGIPPDERERVFQEFYRGRNGLGRGGHGLGLFLVRHIIEAHGGSVEVQSEVGRGSRFRLLFPAAAPGTGATEG